MTLKLLVWNLLHWNLLFFTTFVYTFYTLKLHILQHVIPHCIVLLVMQSLAFFSFAITASYMYTVYGNPLGHADVVIRSLLTLFYNLHTIMMANEVRGNGWATTSRLCKGWDLVLWVNPSEQATGVMEDAHCVTFPVSVAQHGRCLYPSCPTKVIIKKTKFLKVGVSWKSEEKVVGIGEIISVWSAC